MQEGPPTPHHVGVRLPDGVQEAPVEGKLGGVHVDKVGKGQTAVIPRLPVGHI